MPRNVEIKARVNDLEMVENLSKSLADTGPIVIQQEDIFFNVPKGRLKLRKFDSDHGELIYYERPDTLEPKVSHYLRTTTNEPDMLAETLSGALGTRGAVRKIRTIYLVGQTRIHLDRVVGLGAFIELEVVLEQEQTLESGAQIAHQLIQKLGIGQADLVEKAYIDLLEEIETIG